MVDNHKVKSQGQSAEGYRELSFDDPQHLEDYLNSAEELYAEAKVTEEFFVNSDFSGLFHQNYSGQEVFHLFDERMTDLRKQSERTREIISTGKTLSDEDIDQLQEDYDQVCDIQKSIIEVHSKVRGSGESRSVDAGSVPNLKIDATPVEYKKLKAKDVIKEIEMPTIGAGGALEVSELRQALVVARDSNIDLISSPDRQILVDKLIRRLGRITGGIRPEDESEIKALIESIKNPTYTKPQPKVDDIKVRPMVKSKKLELNDDSEVKPIAIIVSAGAEQEIAEESVKSSKAAIHNSVINKDLPPSESKVVSLTEKSDPINKLVKEEVSNPEVTSQLHEEDRSEYLNDPLFSTLFHTTKLRKKDLDRIIRAEVIKIEKATLDHFESWLGERSQSSFDFIKNLTVDEITELLAVDNTREIVRSEGLKYETFLAWAEMFPEVVQVVEPGPDMTFGETYDRFVAMNIIDHHDYELERQKEVS